jgi:hypothetical protein
MNADQIKLEIPGTWIRQGLVIPRSAQSTDYGVMGDPCIVWDDEVSAWRMFLFMDPPGHGQSLSAEMDAHGLPVRWSAPEPLKFEGEAKKTHKPYLVQEADRPNQRRASVGNTGS